jgi:hypothetical protein
MIRAEYTVMSDGVKAEIILPEELTGKLLWKGKETNLHGGAQKIRLPPR